MMVTLGIYLRRWQRTVRRLIQEPGFHALAQSVLYIMGGFFLSAASLGNHPQSFALGFLLTLSGWPAVLAAAGGMAGYLVFWGSAGAPGVIWLCAGLIGAVLLGGRQLLQRLPLLMSALGGAITAVTGAVFALWLKQRIPLPMYLLQTALAVGSTYLFQRAAVRRDSVTDWLMTGVAVLALSQVVPIPYLGFGYILAGYAAAGGAFPAAAMAGLALDLAGITPVPMTGALCLGYVVRLVPGLSRRVLSLAPGLCYLLVMTLCGEYDLQPLPGLAAGGILCALLPRQTEVSRRRGETGFAQVRLELAASVLSQTELLLQDTQEAPIDEQALIARAADRACGSCPARKACRAEPGKMSTALLHKPLGNGEDLDAKCRKTGRLLQELRRSQEQLRSIRADRDRMLEYRAAVVQQYGFLSDYLQSLSDTLASRAEPSLPSYQPELAVCSASRESANGDRCLWFAGTQCRYYLLLCDGMGTGEAAAREGRRAAAMLKKMLTAGFPAEFALRSINSLCALQGRAGAVTVDLAELRLDTGRAAVYKWGAAPSYLVSRGEALRIGTATPPPGLSVTEGRETVERLSLRTGEMLVLLSDGAGGEESLTAALSGSIPAPGELAARILELGSGSTDDATVAVVRLGACTPA